MKITEAIKAIPGGRFFSITYRTDMVPYMKEKCEGIEIWKVTTKSVRTGVAYKELKSTKEKEAVATTKNVSKNWEWIIPNRIKHNYKTNKDYVRVAGIPGNKSKRVYDIIVKDKKGDIVYWYSDVPECLIKQLLKPNKGETPSVQDISFENIVSINNRLVD